MLQRPAALDTGKRSRGRSQSKAKKNGIGNAMRFTAVAIDPTSDRRTKMGDIDAPTTPNNRMGKAQRLAK